MLYVLSNVARVVREHYSCQSNVNFVKLCFRSVRDEITRQQINDSEQEKMSKQSLRKCWSAKRRDKCKYSNGNVAFVFFYRREISQGNIPEDALGTLWVEAVSFCWKIRKISKVFSRCLFCGVAVRLRSQSYLFTSYSYLSSAFLFPNIWHQSSERKTNWRNTVATRRWHPSWPPTPPLCLEIVPAYENSRPLSRVKLCFVAEITLQISIISS